MSEQDTTRHCDELTLLMYVERQLDREAAQEVSLHTQTCTRCLTLLRALDRESRLLTRSMLEQDEALPAKLAEFHEQAKHPMRWIWGIVFGLAALGVYAFYTEYIAGFQQQLEQAGFGGSNLLSLMVFQGAFWKGWQSMFTLVEFVALASVASFGVFAIRKYLRRGTALAVMFSSLGLLAAFLAPAPASAAEFRKNDTVTVGKEETIKSDLYAVGDHVRVEGTVDGDLFGFGQQVEISGHVTGDVICFCQSLRISGQVDGDLRSAANNITLTGTIEKSATTFTELLTIEPSGKIGHNLTCFTKSLTLDGNLGRDALTMFAKGTINGSIGGSLSAKGENLTINSNASIAGPAKFEGDNPADVSSGAKLASPLEYKKMEHRSHQRPSFSVWTVIWAAAYILFGLVLLSILPSFSREASSNVENVGASFGLGVLVLFAVPIAAVIACITVVGLFVGLSTLFLWYGALYFAQIIVGATVGQWILGRTTDTWGFIGRMVVGIIILRIAMAVPFLGMWIKFAVIVWGMGALSLAIYRRMQPAIAPNIPPVPLPGPTAPLPSNTTVGG